MAPRRSTGEEEQQLLTRHEDDGRPSLDSLTSASTTSLVLERLGRDEPTEKNEHNTHSNGTLHKSNDDDYDPEDLDPFRPRPVDRKYRRWLWIVGIIALAGWLLALVVMVSNGSYKAASTPAPHDPLATQSTSSGKKITLDQILHGFWASQRHELSWITSPNGQDGMILEKGAPDKGGYLVVEDIRKFGKSDTADAADNIVLMKERSFTVDGNYLNPEETWVSPDFKKVLIATNKIRGWRHSFTAKYWIFDVATQTAEAMDPANPNAMVKLVHWSPNSDAVVFVRNNNMFLRQLDSDKVEQITTDGGSELFYAVPDWVYEEEVFGDRSAMWWSPDGRYMAFLRTNESMVPTYPIQYFVSRPSGKKPKQGEENYPDVKEVKYPKAGAPNPIVHVQFYDFATKEIFDLDIENDFDDDDRLITEIVWAGKGKVLVRETNRVSDILKVVLMDVDTRKGVTVREEDVKALDGGWFEISMDTTFVPADPNKGRQQDGYIDTVIHEGYDHLGYFTPLDNPHPILLTSGEWEVVDAPSSVDLENNLVYFVSTKESSITRHVYSVSLLDGGNTIQALTNPSSQDQTEKEAYYSISFSKGSGYALLTYSGPSIPWQKVISTPSLPSGTNFSPITIEDNKALAQKASEHEIPLKTYSQISVPTEDGGANVTLNAIERRPPHFDPSKKYPVLFFQYSGPMSQMVDRTFRVDFQSYISSALNAIVVTVDGRGTGFRGRALRSVIRDSVGIREAADQISAGKIWAQKSYVEEDSLAIWGWSYGGYMTLKTLEMDGGRTFRYGMAVAPVTDWRLYDSIYTERYMHTPATNPQGYTQSAITNATALAQVERFLLMHGTGDDNVHFQNSLKFLDGLDAAHVENYDVHVFPDSDHGIAFNGAGVVVWEKLRDWIRAAWEGVWLDYERGEEGKDIVWADYDFTGKEENGV